MITNWPILCGILCVISYPTVSLPAVSPPAVSSCSLFLQSPATSPESPVAVFSPAFSPFSLFMLQLLLQPLLQLLCFIIDNCSRQIWVIASLVCCRQPTGTPSQHPIAVWCTSTCSSQACVSDTRWTTPHPGHSTPVHVASRDVSLMLGELPHTLVILHQYM